MQPLTIDLQPKLLVRHTYNDDGSKKQGAESFRVQELTMNGRFQALPTTQISSETQKIFSTLK